MRILPTMLLTASVLALAGCPSARQGSSSAPPGGAAPIVFQLQQQDDSLQDQRVRTLLDFESESDLTFVRSDGPLSIQRSGAHTGLGAVQTRGSTITFRISSVLFGTRLPGSWTLLGAYAMPPVNTRVSVELLDADRPIARSANTIAGGRWTFVGVDLTDPNTTTILERATQLSLRLTIESPSVLSGTAVDDVLLIDNNKTLLDTLSSGAGGWKISRRGYTTTIDAPGRFKVNALAAATNDRGWLLAEHGPTRVILRSAGPIKTWVLYNDGRFIEDGRLSVKGASGEAVVESHASPAEIEVDETTGKLDIHTEGDSDNDGYNELRGSYQLVARAPRVQLKIKPGRVPAAAPVLEIRDLPAGNVTAMVEGRLIEQSSRLPDGRVLVTLPLRIDRPMAITIRSAP